MATKYIIKVEVAVYESTGDCDDLIRLNITATATDPVAAVRLARKFHDNAAAEIQNQTVPGWGGPKTS